MLFTPPPPNTRFGSCAKGEVWQPPTRSTLSYSAAHHSTHLPRHTLPDSVPPPAPTYSAHPPPPHPPTQIATICAMVSVGASILYRPKDKAVFADNAHKNFARGNVGDHLVGKGGGVGVTTW